MNLTADQRTQVLGLYNVATLSEAERDFAAIAEARQKHSRPLLDEFQAWLEKERLSAGTLLGHRIAGSDAAASNDSRNRGADIYTDQTLDFRSLSAGMI